MAPTAPVAPGVDGQRASPLELADIVRAPAADYRRPHRLSRAQHRALDAIATCRPAALGGHRAVCAACGAERITYNSCRNRHCPKCQRVAPERWLAARRRDGLPSPYFHVVFTLPPALNPLAQRHPRRIYRVLFESAASTLLRCGRDPRHLGGALGIPAVLHTWGQTLAQHLHVHCVVTGGALAPDGTRWISARSPFLFPVRALAKVFRGRYLAALQRAVDRGELHCTGGLAALAEPAAFTAWLTELRRSAGVVYCPPPFAGPEPVLAYLGRDPHRVALSNQRLVAFADGHVRFRWRDYADGDREKVMELAVDEFLRRFLLHVVPDRFVRIRHFGLLANRRRTAAARTLSRALDAPAAPGAAPRIGGRTHAPRHGHRHRALSGLSAGPAPHRRAARSHAGRLGHVMNHPPDDPLRVADRRTLVVTLLLRFVLDVGPHRRRDGCRHHARRVPRCRRSAILALACRRCGVPVPRLAPSSSR